jgi:hypothetical protein
LYLGWRVYDEKRDPAVKIARAGGRRGGRPKIARAPDEIIRVRVIEEPAIAPERFARVQAALKEVRRNHASSHTARHPSLCTTIGRCGCCAEPLYATANGKKRKNGENYGYYCCKSHYPEYAGTLPKCANGWVRRDALDELLVAFCQQTLTDPVLLAAIIDASARRTAEILRPFPAPSPDDAVARLRQKDKRLVEMCEAETLTIEEFRARRAVLRKEIECLENIKRQTTDEQPAQVSLAQLARQITRAAVRFANLRDKHAQKTLLIQLFGEVLFRGESITGFRFSNKFLADVGGDAVLGGGMVQLETPFRLREPVPAGHKRCKCCGQFRPFADYYTRRAQCRPCYLVRHRALKAAREAK